MVVYGGGEGYLGRGSYGLREFMYDGMGWDGMGLTVRGGKEWIGEAFKYVG